MKILAYLNEGIPKEFSEVKDLTSQISDQINSRDWENIPNKIVIEDEETIITVKLEIDISHMKLESTYVMDNIEVVTFDIILRTGEFHTSYSTKNSFPLTVVVDYVGGILKELLAIAHRWLDSERRNRMHSPESILLFHIK